MSMQFRLLLALAVVAASSATVVPAHARADVPDRGAPVPSDFNGDGFSDLAVGVRGEGVGGVSDTGAVNVLYGTGVGLDDVGNQFWDQEGTGSASNGVDDGFGFAAASGDFDRDGFADLAVGVPGKEVGGVALAGAVSVLYGSPAGLLAAGSQQWDQNSANVEGDAGTEDFFGWSVATGDFNRDGFDDLAVGIPGEMVGGEDSAGAVSILLGSPAGLTATGDQLWHQDSTDVNNAAEAGDQFGLAVGTGDFDGNGFADLAVGAPTENLNDGADAGGVNVLYGSAAGLIADDDDFWNQGVAGIKQKVEPGDWFGYRVTGGDFNGDGFDDLLTGVPQEDLSGFTNAGGASAIYGTAAGLDEAGDDFWHQDSGGISRTAGAGDEFALSIATGDFDGDGFDDAAMGVPGEDVSDQGESGGVAVIYGTAGGLDDPDDDFWHQDDPQIKDSAEFLDRLGHSVMAGNFGNGPQDDLAIGAILEVVGGEDSAGAVNVIYGSPSDLISTENQFWHQDSDGVLDSAEDGDWFGFGLGQPGAASPKS
jgi:hypothetical protein